MMLLSALDWAIIIAFFILSVLIGLYASRTAGKSAVDFFLSGRNMPWWLLGVSMVATTFSADTPNLVTDLVRQHGVAGNWAWWAFLLTGMLTVFVYAKLWRRTNIMTDLEFYELRYSGKMAAFLRGFRALYLGVFFNIVVMATVCLAITKLGAVFMGWTSLQTLLVILTITGIYSTIGGLKGIVLTDFFQFIISMVGMIGAAILIVQLPEIKQAGGLTEHEDVIPKLNILPDFDDYKAFLAVFLLPLLVQWWSVWYPGSEPGGGGYIAQRMLSARNEKDAIGATLLFNVFHYALRPWPWIVIALASVVVFPDLESLRAAFPNVDKDIVQNDFAFPAMLSFLPNGFTGLVVASLIAAFMSTISTQINWGSSYIVNDYYSRFVNPEASEKRKVLVGRIWTVILLVATLLFTLLLKNALQAFQIMLQVGAGTGLLFILRWFWWRINVYSELAGMIISFLVAIYLEIVHTNLGFEALSAPVKLVTGVGITTLGWITITLLTPPTDTSTLRSFYKKIYPGGPGWKKVVDEAYKDGENLKDSDAAWDVPAGILCMIVGVFAVYSVMFATGYWIYGNVLPASILTITGITSSYILFKLWGRLKFNK